MVEVGNSQIQTMLLFHFFQLQVALERVGEGTFHPRKLRAPNLGFVDKGNKLLQSWQLLLLRGKAIAD